MNISTALVIYLTVFRLAIISAGIISIVLGYKLFLYGVFPGANRYPSKEEENVVAEFAGAKFSLRNAAPGTCFGFFGVIVIVTMLIMGAPGYTVELFERGGMKKTIRGDEILENQSQSKIALDYLGAGEKARAAETVQLALKKMAGPLNDFAWVLLKTNPESRQMIQLAEVAVTTDPENPNFLHTLAEIQFFNGDKKKALKTLEEAQSINPAYTELLNRRRSENLSD
jgi:tetratricopeptide (TPR) repeat protein